MRRSSDDACTNPSSVEISDDAVMSRAMVANRCDSNTVWTTKRGMKCEMRIMLLVASDEENQVAAVADIVG